MSLPYFPLFPADFDADTAHLTLIEDGAYNRLLRLCWRTPGCKVPAEEDWLFRKLRATSEDEKAAIRSVIGEFFVRRGGSIYNPRLTKEHSRVNATYQQQILAGQKGGLAKARNRKEKASSEPSVSLTNFSSEPLATRTITRTIEEEGTNVPSNGDFENFWNVWPNKVAKDRARKAWKAMRPPEREAAAANAAAWFDGWRAQHPDASPIHPATYLNGRRWADAATQPKPEHRNGSSRDNAATLAAEIYRRQRGMDFGPGPGAVVPLLPPGRSGAG